MNRTVRIHPGQVWVTRKSSTRTPSRRVLQVAGGRVCYSTGTELTRWCQPRAFRLWIRKYQAVATRTRRKRSIVLRRSSQR